MTPHILLLCPSRGLGGGIERYVQTVEAALTAHEVRYERLGLLDGVPDSTPRRKLAFAAKVVRPVRRADGPVVLVLAHRNLLSLLPLIRPAGTVADTVVIVHGSELWSGRQRGGRQMGRDDVRVLAASSFSAGALLGRTQAGVLPPGLSSTWYDDASGEGLGLVLLEAQVAGTPVVAPAYGGSADAFHADVTGLPPRDESAEALGAVLWALTTDEHLRAEMGTAAAAWARSGFAPARYARRVLTALIGKADR